MTILDRFFNLLKPGWKVLDLGAGEGKQAQEMTKLGVVVVAVDSKEPKNRDASISWNVLPIREWILKLSDNDLFDAILARNSLQFFKKDLAQLELLPILSAHLKSGGLIAIETFYQDPEPAFERPFWSYWTLEELKASFPGWEIIDGEMKKENNPDLAGKVRDFYKTGLLIKKP